MQVPGLSLLGPKRIRGFVSILRYINPTIIIINSFQVRTDLLNSDNLKVAITQLWTELQV